jgi:hypothetical protein
VGTALSPEFIYTVGPGDLMPDDRCFGIVWMSEKALASVYDLDGAFSYVSVKLQRDASEREIITVVRTLDISHTCYFVNENSTCPEVTQIKNPALTGDPGMPCLKGLVGTPGLQPGTYA